jgi:hypothetical protein
LCYAENISRLERRVCTRTERLARIWSLIGRSRLSAENMHNSLRDLTKTFYGAFAFTM